jgi:hypothetical protein
LTIATLAVATLAALVSPWPPPFATWAFATLIIPACFISAYVVATAIACPAIGRAIASVLASGLPVAVELIMLLFIIGIIAIRRRRRTLLANRRQAIADRRGVKRCREALAHILHIDIGDR